MKRKVTELSTWVEPSESRKLTTGRKMTKITENPLGASGLRHMVSELRGERGLSGRFAELVARSGQTFAVLPEEALPGHLEKFETGTSLGMDAPYKWMARHLEDLCATAPNGSLVIHDVWAKASDPVNGEDQRKLFFAGDGVYYFVNAADFSAEQILRTMREVTSFKMVGAYTRSPALSAPLPSDSIADEDLLDSLAKDVIEIFISAYDQEGFVIWRP